MFHRNISISMPIMQRGLKIIAALITALLLTARSAWRSVIRSAGIGKGIGSGRRKAMIAIKDGPSLSLRAGRCRFTSPTNTIKDIPDGSDGSLNRSGFI